MSEEESINFDYIKLPNIKYLDYTAGLLDHTYAQLHSWGDTLVEAFEQCGLAIYGYMTDLEKVEIKQNIQITASGYDLESLLLNFLAELLSLFSCEPNLICSKLEISEFITEGENYSIKCSCYGEEFQLGKHPQGTEVQAITYSAMKIVNDDEHKDYEVFVTILLNIL